VVGLVGAAERPLEGVEASAIEAQLVGGTLEALPLLGGDHAVLERFREELLVDRFVAVELQMPGQVDGVERWVVLEIAHAFASRQDGPGGPSARTVARSRAAHKGRAPCAERLPASRESW